MKSAVFIKIQLRITARHRNAIGFERVNFHINLFAIIEIR